MAVARTRTRTQTALTKVVELLAEANGEIQVLEQLLANERDVAVRSRLMARHQELQDDHSAVRSTLEQFDSDLDAERVGTSYKWLKAFGRGRPALARYVQAVLAGER